MKTKKQVGPAMCSITDKECPYPSSYCSVCSKDNDSGTHEQASLWNRARQAMSDEEIMKLFRDRKED